jgi:tetratricopeptide (TPR) repeat protein
VELRLRRLAPSETEVILEANDSSGYVLVRPLYNSLTKFEQAAPSMPRFFPDMVRSIDVATEEKRVAQLHFLPSLKTPEDAEREESVAHKEFHVPSTLPNDQSAIAALSEGERRLAEKNPQGAEESFKKVLAKYPEQPRALYGMGLVAYLEHDGAKAKEVFGQLTTGEHAATQDPMVLAWSHVYLGRIYGDEGDLNMAKNEFQAALGVSGGPERARRAAEEGLTVVNRLEPKSKP